MNDSESFYGFPISRATCEDELRKHEIPEGEIKEALDGELMEHSEDGGKTYDGGEVLAYIGY